MDNASIARFRRWGLAAPLFLLAGPAQAKECVVGKPCGDTCIEVADTCHVGAGTVQPRYSTERNVGAPVIGAYLDSYYAEKERLETAKAARDDNNNPGYRYDAGFAAMDEWGKAEEERMAKMQRLMDAGKRAVDEGDYGTSAAMYANAAFVPWCMLFPKDDDLGQHVVAAYGAGVAYEAAGNMRRATDYYILSMVMGDGWKPKRHNQAEVTTELIRELRKRAEEAIGAPPFPGIDPKPRCKSYIEPDGDRGQPFAKGEKFYPAFADGEWVWGWHDIGDTTIGEWVKEKCLFGGIEKAPDVVRLEYRAAGE